MRRIPELVNLGQWVTWCRHAHQTDELAPAMLFEESVNIAPAP